MPLRALAVTSRHHPVAVSCYVGITTLAVLYIVGLANATSMQRVVGYNVTRFWEFFLLMGGITTLVGVFLPARALFAGLSVEALGTFIIGFELGTYSGVLFFGSITKPEVLTPIATILVFSGVAVGCLCRTWTALRDKKRIMKAVSMGLMASPPPLGDPSS